MQSLKKSWEWIARTKQLTFLSRDCAKMIHFGKIRVFFINWTPSYFSKHNDVKLCEIFKNFSECIMRKAAYRPINNLE